MASTTQRQRTRGCRTPPADRLGRDRVGVAAVTQPQLTITVHVTVTAPVRPGTARRIMQEVERFGDRMAVEVSLPTAGDDDRTLVELVPASRGVYVDGRRVDLGRREFELLLYLARNRSRPVSRDELLATVWKDTWAGRASRTVDVHVTRLRAKTGQDVVVTVHGVGYAIGDRVFMIIHEPKAVTDGPADAARDH